MKYSVIIPVYNCIDYLRSCVESIPKYQEDLEILLVDDGATDGSGVLCDQLAGEYLHVRVIHQENSGVSAARNRGIREAKGEYLLFVDSDDTVDTQKLNQLLDVFPDTGADMAVFGICFDFYRAEKLYRSDVLAYPYDGLLSRQMWPAVFSELFSNNAISSACTKILKKTMLEKHSIRFSQQMFLYEDLEFMLRYLSHSQDVWCDSRGIYHYRQSEDEGNAARRLMRIDSLRAFMKPLEAAMEGLSEIVPENQRKQVLLQLYLVLARGKIGSSDIPGIRRLCEDYRQWSAGRNMPVVDEKFQSRLAQGKAMALYLQNKKTALRHKIAVAVKSKLYRK